MLNQHKEKIEKNRNLVILSCILIIGILLRLIYLIKWGSYFDIDEILPGLMSKHILEGKELPVFYYGQNYLGAFESYVGAMFFWIFGISILSCKLAPFLFSVLLIITTFYFGKCLYDEKIGLLSAMFMSIPTSYIFEWSLAARSGFVEHLVVFTLMGTLFWSIFVKEDNSLVKVSLFGFVCGLGLWIYQTVVIYFVIFLVLGIPRLKSMDVRKFVIPFSLFFLMGSFPFVIFQIFHPLATAEILSMKFFQVEASEYYKHGVVSSILSGIINQLNPALWINNYLRIMGGEVTWFSSIFRFHNLVGIFLGIIVLKFFFQRLKISWRFNLKNFEGIDFLILLFVFTFILGHEKARYLMPCYIVVMVIYSYFISHIKKKNFRFVFIALLLMANAYGTISLLVKGPINMELSHSYEKVINFLESEGLYFGYSGYETGYPINFLSGEKITISAKCGPYYIDRYPKYRQKVESADRVFFIFKDGTIVDKIFQDKLAGLKIYCQKKKIQKYNVYYPILQTQVNLLPFPIYNPDRIDKQ